MAKNFFAVFFFKQTGVRIKGRNLLGGRGPKRMANNFFAVFFFKQTGVRIKGHCIHGVPKTDIMEKKVCAYTFSAVLL